MTPSLLHPPRCRWGPSSAGGSCPTPDDSFKDTSEETDISDDDGDGYPVGQDCDDTDPAAHPNAEELCNGYDASAGLLSESTTGALTTSSLTWSGYELIAPVPIGTAAWEVELRGTLYFGSYTNAFFDDTVLGCYIAPQ